MNYNERIIFNLRKIIYRGFVFALRVWSVIKALAKLPLFCMPPLNSFGSLFSTLNNPTSAKHSQTISLINFLDRV